MSKTIVFSYVGYIALSLILVCYRYNFTEILVARARVFESWRNWVLTALRYAVRHRVMKTDKQHSMLVLILAVVHLLVSVREFRNFYGGSSFSCPRRAGETFSLRGLNSNHFAAFVAHLCALLVGMFAEDKRKGRRRLYLAAIVAGMYPLLFSYSRGAYAAFGLAVFAVGVTRYRPLIFFGIIAAIFWHSIIPESVADRVSMTESPDGELEESAALRLVVWNLAEQLFGENPVFGIGFQGFFASADLPLHNAHNYFLQTAAEQGAVGVTLLMAILLRALWTGWVLARTGDTQTRRGLGPGFFALTLALTMANVFGDRFSLMEWGSYFWFFFGVAQRIVNERRESLGTNAYNLKSPSEEPAQGEVAVGARTPI